MGRRQGGCHGSRFSKEWEKIRRDTRSKRGKLGGMEIEREEAQAKEEDGKG